MAVTLNASTTTGLVQSADTSGAINIQSNGTTVLGVTSTGASVTGTQSVSGDLSFNSGYGSVAKAYGCRAWVSFNGTGTVAIRASGNVTSITDDGTGLYTVVIDNDMPDANYSTVLAGIGLSATNNSQGIPQLRNGSTPSTSAVSIQVGAHDSNQLLDSSYVQVAIFR